MSEVGKFNEGHRFGEFVTGINGSEAGRVQEFGEFVNEEFNASETVRVFNSFSPEFKDKGMDFFF